MARYQPKRSSKRWLEGAPPALLAVYDNGGKSADRYTALYGAPLWEPSYGNKVPCRFMSQHPSHPQGIGLFGEHPSHERSALGRKVTFKSLPPDVQRCIVADCSCDDCGKPFVGGKPCDCKRATHWVYMFGMSGYMPDSISTAETKADAIESVLFIFSGQLSERELKRAKRALREDGIYYFSERAKSEGIGAEYCEVSEEPGPCPEDD